MNTDQTTTIPAVVFPYPEGGTWAGGHPPQGVFGKMQYYNKSSRFKMIGHMHKKQAFV